MAHPAYCRTAISRRVSGDRRDHGILSKSTRTFRKPIIFGHKGAGRNVPAKVAHKVSTILRSSRCERAVRVEMYSEADGS